MTAMISAVPREHVGNVWPVVSPMLDNAIKRTHGRWHNVDILTSVLDGSASLWIAFNEDKKIIGSMIFTINAFPVGMQVGRIDYVAGENRDEWFDAIFEKACEYARDRGCNKIETVCRKGVGEYVKRYGMKEIGTYYEMDL